MGAVFSVVGALLTITFIIFVVLPNRRGFFLVMAHSGDSGKLISVNFEVHGRVQGVFFRKHTNQQARELKLVGWVMNTYHDTVKGNIQGPKSHVEKMKKWLSEVGSPSSEIKKCDFTDEEEIPQLEHKGFRIIRMCTAENPTMKLISVDYEVSGKVQGVCFRMHTQEMAKKYRLVGWVKNTTTGTVIGTIQGPTEKVDTLKKWLKNTGSPNSQITGCKFSNERDINSLEFCNFTVRHERPSI